MLFFKAVERGWLRKWYYGDVVLYALGCAVLFHAVINFQHVTAQSSYDNPHDYLPQAFFEAHNLRLGYWFFLDRITYGKLSELNYDAIDHFGTQASTRVRQIREQKRKKQN